MEGWHRQWNAHFGAGTANLRLSTVVKKMLVEDSGWASIIGEFERDPARGIREATGVLRRSVYVALDNSLLQDYNQINDKDPLTYLKLIAHRLHAKKR